MRITDLVPWRKSEFGPTRNGDSPFLSLQREMNELFDRFFSDWDSATTGSVTFSPRVNVSENEKSLVVSAEIPGIEPESVDVTLTHDSLTIKGEKQHESEEKDEERNFYRVERSYGAFTRVIPLPVDAIDTDNVEAEFKNGVLTVTLAKRPEAQSVVKKIAVNVG